MKLIVRQVFQSYAEDLAHMIVVQCVNDGLSFPTEAYQLGSFQCAQLMADGTLGHTQQIGQITDT